MSGFEQVGPSHHATIFAPAQRTLPAYLTTDAELECGASFGNAAIWVNTKGNGAIERIFSIERGESLIGAVSVRYGGMGHALMGALDVQARTARQHPYIGLRQDAAARVEIHPAFQRRRFTIASGVTVTETIFLTYDPRYIDPPIAYFSVELSNRDPVAYDLRVGAYAQLRGHTKADIVARFDKRLNAIVGWSKSHPESVRIFAVSCPPSYYATTFDSGSLYDPSHVHTLDDSLDATGDVLGGLQVDFTLGAGATRKFGFAAAVYARGEKDAIKRYQQALDFESGVAKAVEYLSEELEYARVYTPDVVINQGALWSKVNMRRVMAGYPQGPAFTNDPGVSSNVVIRDGAWMVYGCDHFAPHFSRTLLEKFAAVQSQDGKLPEFYNAIDGRIEDYGLNINDDTPLFILAVNHHWRATGDKKWLRRMYPVVAKAARYILSQIDERGLVVCTADDSRGNVWAIAGWRNIIADYLINGAVTEINAECAAALRAAAHLAENLGKPKTEVQSFRHAETHLRSAMDKHLLNPENGLYYLNVDLDGNAHTDVTGDQVFPVMLRVCDEETGYRIIRRLDSPDFWTSGGLRTVSRDDPMYDPTGNMGLLGGVWPGLTWWYAFAAARYRPDFMVRALRSSFAHYATNPKINNTVPGQFSEWFDGESLVNRGMRLSPWEPPRFLWAAIEGVCGMSLRTGPPQVEPLIPQDWKWLGVRRLRYHGKEISYFATRRSGTLHISGTTVIGSKHASETYEEDISEQVYSIEQTIAVIALRKPDKVLLLAGNVSEQTVAGPINLAKAIDKRRTYDVRCYDSERNRWTNVGRLHGARLQALSVQIETGGFRLLELRDTQSEHRPRAVKRKSGGAA